MDHKSAVVEILTRLQRAELIDSEHWQALEQCKETAKREADPAKLFYMYQSLRELVAKELEGRDAAPFKVKQPDGSIIEYKNLEEFRAKVPAQGRIRRLRRDNPNRGT
jgi:hypothetical protein